MFLRAVQELMEPVECPERLDRRYVSSFPDQQLIISISEIIVAALFLVVRRHSAPFAQGDRGFDGLPGLPGEKGHRVSQLFKSE